MNRILLTAASVLALSACAPDADDSPTNVAADKPAAAPAKGAVTAANTNTASFAPIPVAPGERAPVVLRAQVLLDRARFSPGVIDGTAGENLRQAVAAYEEANALPVDGRLDEAVFQKLTAADGRPVLADYVITEEDAQGPFATLPDNMTDQAKLDSMAYESLSEAIAEKFHMTEELLAELNPGIVLAPGATIAVVQPGNDDLPADVALIEVDKADKALRAYDAGGRLLAFYPATIGSEERPAPEGVLKVAGVSDDPTYTFDPERLTYSQPGVKGKLTLQPGPNNPVGVVWIALSKPTFGIHGADDPKEIGKTFSHGCIRLTNWDAEELADSVEAGVKVSFLEVTAGGLREQQAKKK